MLKQTVEQTFFQQIDMWIELLTKNFMIVDKIVLGSWSSRLMNRHTASAFIPLGKRSCPSAAPFLATLALIKLHYIYLFIIISMFRKFTIKSIELLCIIFSSNFLLNNFFFFHCLHFKYYFA